MIKIMARKDYNALPEEQKLREDGRNFVVVGGRLVLVLFREEV
jgi:hypothetical protein